MLEITQISKAVGGKSVLSALSLTVENKGIFGVLCVDSTAKALLARLICGCEDADEGTVRVNGEPMSRRATELKKKVRLVPSVLKTDSMETAAEYLDFVGSALGIEPDRRYRQIKEALELLGIDGVQSKPFFALNSVQCLRLAIASSLIGNPDIIVIDDALWNIEGKQLEEIYEILQMLGKIKTVILLSHKPSEVKRLCERIAFMCGGRIVLSGSIAEIEEKINSTRELRISVRGDWEKISAVIKDTERVVDVKLISSDKNSVHSISVEHLPDSKMKDRLFEALSKINAPMLQLKAIELTLDDVFYSLTDKDRKRIEAEREEAEKNARGGRKK